MTAQSSHHTGDGNHRRKHSRRFFVIVGSAAGAAAIVVAAVIGFSLRSGDGGRNAQPAASTPARATMLWKAEYEQCPKHPSTTATAGAVMKHDAGCVRLVKRLATFTSLDATVAGSNGHWWVKVSPGDRQAAAFDRATKADRGHLLAIIDSGEVIAAPVVSGSIASYESGLQIAAASKSQAKHFARLLTDR